MLRYSYSELEKKYVLHRDAGENCSTETLKLEKVYGNFDLIRHQEGHHAFFHCAVHNLGNSTVGFVKGRKTLRGKSHWEG